MYINVYANQIMKSDLYSLQNRVELPYEFVYPVVHCLCILCYVTKERGGKPKCKQKFPSEFKRRQHE